MGKPTKSLVPGVLRGLAVTLICGPLFYITNNFESNTFKTYLGAFCLMVTGGVIIICMVGLSEFKRQRADDE